MMRAFKLFGLGIALALPAMASAAQTFQLSYATFVDSTSGPATTINATITTEDKNSYDNGYFVTGISGTRGSDALIFNDNFDEIYFPGDPSGNIVDIFGLTFFAGGTLYNFYKGSGDAFYHEFDGSTGRIVMNEDVSLTLAPPAVPEPATWAMMIGGFVAIGSLARYRRRRLSVAFG
jgi:hypothetical protein